MKNIFDRIRTYDYSIYLYWIVMLFGALFRIRQYAANRSFWVDEASLALNIVDRNFAMLMKPLDYNQGAPIGFLFIEKFLVTIFGNFDYVLRIFPLIAGLVSLYFVYRLANELLGRLGLLVVFWFSFSGSMIYYSSELKQYSSDVMFATALTWCGVFYLKKIDLQLRDVLILGVLGIIAIFSSHPAAFVLPVVGVLLAFEKFRAKKYSQLRLLLGMGVVWGGTFFASYLFTLRNLIGNDFLQRYWGDSYAPLPPWQHLDWYRNVFYSLLPELGTSFWDIFSQQFHQTNLLNFCLLLATVGSLSLLLRDKKMAILIISPFVLMFVASVLDRYPMYDRFIYFWVPSLFFLVAEGLAVLYRLLSKINRQSANLIYIFLFLLLAWTPTTNAFANMVNPQMGEDIKPVLAYIRENKQVDDVIYVHNGGVNSFRYYAPFYELDTEYSFVADKSSNFKRFLIDVDDLIGNERVWFVFSHVTYCDCDAVTSAGRVDHHIQILDGFGNQLDRFEASRSYAYLYDLNP